jgi:hypothetical protein
MVTYGLTYNGENRMNYVKASGNTVEKYPYSIGLLRKENPNTSFPKKMGNEQLASWGVYPVLEVSDPEYDVKTERVLPDPQPTFIEGTWVRKKSVVALSEEEIAIRTNALEDSNRTERDRKIAETDWWASSDLTMTAEQTAYRQALRDITSHANWPHLEAADWPTKPE